MKRVTPIPIRASWEERVEERIIKPMYLKTAGFGPQTTLGRVDAPLGHILVNRKTKAMLAGPNGDNPLLLGPAGTIHLSVLDFANGWRGMRARAIAVPFSFGGSFEEDSHALHFDRRA